MTVFSRQHSWQRATFFSLSIALCITIDIFQHSVPLPFLPQALSAQGHSTMEIASVMGSYYWSGCAGGLLLTMYQVHRVLYGAHTESTWGEMRSHTKKLIFGLTIGMLTLLAEAKNPDWIPDIQVHLGCRLLQGFVGAFLFFYSYLLSVKLFEGPQQVFALTCASIALNVAEVFGPMLGAAIFTWYGAAMPYLVLAGLSVLNNVLLWFVIQCMPTDGPDGEPTETSPLVPAAPPPRERSYEERMALLRKVFREPALWRAVLVIAPAAAVKSCFESILPLFGGQKSYDELQVGMLFCIAAVAYIAASVSVGYLWLSLSPTTRNLLITFSLGGLACAAGAVLTSYRINWHLGDLDYTRHEVFYLFLFAYGIFLGLTHTPAAYLLGNAVDAFEDAAAQDAVNGVFNTCWELGGSLGFIISGWASHHDWRQEQLVLGTCGAVVGMSGFLFILTSARGAGGLVGTSPEPSKLLP